MTIITKKELFKYNKSNKKKSVEEFVDVDGSFIEGDEIENSDSEIKVPNQQTSDDYATQAIQPDRPIGGISNYSTRRIGENKIKNLVSKILEADSSLENLTIEELSKTKSISVNKAKDLINTISKNNLNGAEIGVLLSYILENINIKSIPRNYIKLMKNKL
jgi:hypothetical protein